MNKFTVLRDTKEKVDYWDFGKSNFCLGTESVSLETGDYQIKELPSNILTIDRKRTTSEISQNIFEDRFERELERMEKFKHAFIITQFDLCDIMSFPSNSGIPKFKWGKLRVTADLILRRICEMEINHNVKFVFAGLHAKRYCESLFKRIFERYDK